MSINKILIGIALTLGMLAALIGTPQRNEINVNEIASLIEHEKDHITPVELAGQIFTGEKIRLIDLRDSVSFAQQHIANSENMSIQQLFNGGIKRNERVVVYSEGGIHASQAWILLKMNRFDSIHTLFGGFTGWTEEILYPTLKSGVTKDEINNFERRKTLSLFFGGEPKIISKEMPKKKAVKKIKSQQKQNPPIQRKEEDKPRFQC